MTELFSSMATYFVLLLIIVLLCGIAIFVGISLRKRKNRQEELYAEEALEEE